MISILIVKMNFPARFLFPAVLCLALQALGANPESSATRVRYHALTAQPGSPPPFAVADFLRGPTETAHGQVWHWWQLELRAQTEQTSTPLMTLRALTSADPLDTYAGTPEFARYQLWLPDRGERLEYRDRRNGRALLPAWKDFERWFVPRPTAASHWQQAFPETGELLGHILTLFEVGKPELWTAWPDLHELMLDRELLVGTGRNVKDQEGRRLPQQPERREYTYVPFAAADYALMFSAGLNLFVVSPDQEAFVRDQPVFYMRDAGGGSPLRYPADLYRANYLGPVMFMDEPSVITVGDKLVHTTLRYFSDAAALIEKRTRQEYLSDGSGGAFALQKSLRNLGVNFGDMNLMQWDYPAWETLYDTTFYQMKGGGNGLVHEGRYQLGEFDQAVQRFTGQARPHTARELLAYHFAFLRGGTRPFGKFWGTAIYGQCDTNLAPTTITMAYDMGARYVWFWTSDHEHHVPWPEQLALARTLKEHAEHHPRPSIYGPAPEVDTAIVIPNGYFLSLDKLWWVRVLDQEGQNEASLQYRRLVQRALQAVHQCFDQGRTFDVTIDGGQPIRGYRRILRVDGQP